MHATTDETDSTGRDGLFDLVYHASRAEVESVTLCNIGMAALCLQYLLTVREPDLTCNIR